MLVDRHVKRLDVPHEPGHYLDLRRLSFGELRDLRRESEGAYLAALAVLPDNVLDAQLRMESERAEKRRKAAEEAKAAGADVPAADGPAGDPLAGKDIATVLRFGVVGWSYKGADGEPVPVTGEAIAMLDEATAVWAAREILLLGEDDARKKGSSPSIATSPE